LGTPTSQHPPPPPLPEPAPTPPIGSAGAGPPPAPQYSPPAWLFEPVTAWLYIVLTIGLGLSPLFPLNWVIAIPVAVFVYQDLKNRGLPTTGWVILVLIFGAFALIFYNYRRKALERPIVTTVRAPVTVISGAPAAPPAWYPDPHGQARLRYWDGEQWTNHTSA
jgi:hypothetical protein